MKTLLAHNSKITQNMNINHDNLKDPYIPQNIKNKFIEISPLLT